MAKRLFDVVLAALGLVAAAPFLLVAAVGIRLSSPGPILYRARLLGRDGRPFTMYTRRPMHLNHRARYRIGPGLDRRIPTAATSRNGAAATSPSAARTTSNRRLAIAQAPSYRHEHLGRVHAA